MKILNNKDYQEYQQLKKWAEQEAIYISSVQTQNLEDDIDFPIRKSVAMLALLCYKPLYSCCGFDYVGQPKHKSHQYGEPYIMMELNKDGQLNELNLRYWKIRHTNQVTFIELSQIIKDAMNPHWRNITCPHFSEEIILAINYLEHALLSQRDNFVDIVILKDTNQAAKKHTKYWQYVPKKEWVIIRDNVIYNS